MERRIGAGSAFLGIALAIGQWLIPPDRISYGFRFGLVVVSCLLFVVGIVLLGQAGWYLLFPKKPEKQFCFFSVYYIGTKAHGNHGEFQLLMNGIGIVESVNYWISPWGVEPSGMPNDPYYSLDRRKPLIP